MSNLGDITEYMDENWHGGQIQGDFFNHPEMDIEENNEVEENHQNTVWNWKHAIIRQLMRGKHKNQILSKYKTVIDRFNLQNQITSFLDKNDGLIGYFIVDVSNFDDKFGYNDIPQYMRDCNLYAYGATELRQIISRSLISQNDGTIDGFFGSNDNIQEEISYVDECTGLPCINNLKSSSADNEDERLNHIADLFIGKKWMSASEKAKFEQNDNKLNYLVNIVKRQINPISNADGNYEDDINDYNLQNQDLQADSVSSLKEAEVEEVKELEVDDIGKVDNKEIDMTDFDEVNDFAVQGIENQTDEDIDISTPQINMTDFDETEYFIMENIDEMKSTGLDYMNLDEVIDPLQVQPLEESSLQKIDTKDLIDNKVDLKEMMDQQSDNNEVIFDEQINDIEVDNDKETELQDVQNLDELEDVVIEEEKDQHENDEDLQVDKERKDFNISNKYEWNW